MIMKNHNSIYQLSIYQLSNIDSNIKFKKLFQKFPHFQSISASKAHFY
jgi:hypothetical protein